MIQTSAMLAMACLAGSLSLPRNVAADDGDPLAAYRWRSRILVVAAADEDDPKLRAQRAVSSKARDGMAEHDLVVVEAVGSRADAVRLRRHLGLRDAEFRAVLVGKDGEAKFTSPEPIGADMLFSTIDAMPMRRDEQRRR